MLSLNMNSSKWVELDHFIEKNLGPLTFRTTTVLNRRFCGKNNNLHSQLNVKDCIGGSEVNTSQNTVSAHDLAPE